MKLYRDKFGKKVVCLTKEDKRNIKHLREIRNKRS